MNGYKYPYSNSYNTPVIKPRPTRRRHILAWLLCLALLGYATMRYVEPYAQKITAKQLQKVHAAEKTPRQKAIDVVPAKLAAITAQYPNVNFSISIIDLQNDMLQRIGSADAFDAASTGKLVTAADMLNLVQQGAYSLDGYLQGDTIQDWLQALIVNSDDTAWTVLNTELTHDQLDSYAKSIGLTRYDAAQNTITSNDIAKLLQKLYNNQLLNYNNTQLLLSYMQQANYRGYITAAAPQNATVYHKIGFDDGELNDAAIITSGSHKYALVIYSNDASMTNDDSYDVTADASRTTAFAAITQAVATAYDTN